MTIPIPHRIEVGPTPTATMSRHPSITVTGLTDSRDITAVNSPRDSSESARHDTLGPDSLAIHSHRAKSKDPLDAKRCFCSCCPHESSVSLRPESTSTAVSDEPSSRPDDDDDVPYTIYSKTFCYALVFLASAVASISGFSANVFFPAQEDIATGLGISVEMVNLSITTYIVAQSIAPSVWGPLADLYGRRQILIWTMLVSVGANLGLANSSGAGMLLAFRALQACGSASAISLGQGIVSDVFPSHVRGGANGIFSGARQLSQAFGPVLGGLLAGSLGWQAIFWALLILSATSAVTVTLIYPETLRRISGNGANLPSSLRYRPLLYSCMPFASRRISASDVEARASRAKFVKPARPLRPSVFVEPLRMLLWKDCACALLFGACSYTAWSMMVAITTYMFKFHYGFSTLECGLAFTANGFGCMFGALYSGASLNARWRAAEQTYYFQAGLGVAEYRRSARHSKDSIPVGFQLEQARLGDSFLYAFAMIFGLLIFGWSLQEDAVSGVSFWIVPLLAQFLVGFANTAILNANQTYTVDLARGIAAGASATVNLTRGIPAAVGVACVEYLRDLLEPGYLGLVLCGIVALGLGPAVLIQVYGARWRAERMGAGAAASGGDAAASGSVVVVAVEEVKA